MIKRNTIIILGNGFDIANDLPTKYSDFAEYQLNKIGKSLTFNIFDSTLSTSFKTFHEYYIKKGHPIANNVNKSILKRLVLHIIDKDEEGIMTFLRSHLEYMSSIISNSFLARLYSNNYVNWFDIENAYFEELIKIENDILNYLETVKRDTKKRTSGELKSFIDIKKKEISKLNDELMNYLAAELTRYQNKDSCCL